MRNLQSLNAACDVDDSVGVCSYAHVHCSVMTKYWVPSAFSAEEAQVFTPKHVHRLLCTATFPIIVRGLHLTSQSCKDYKFKVQIAPKTIRKSGGLTSLFLMIFAKDLCFFSHSIVATPVAWRFYVMQIKSDKFRTSLFNAFPCSLMLSLINGRTGRLWEPGSPETAGRRRSRPWVNDLTSHSWVSFTRVTSRFTELPGSWTKRRSPARTSEPLCRK